MSVTKLKTNRGAAKRFKLTGGGKIKFKKAFKSHILTKKSSGRKRRLRKCSFISAADKKRVRKLIPYA